MTGYSRSRSSSEPGPIGTHHHNYSGYPDVSLRLSSDDKTINDVVTPGFKNALARGEVINNPCSIARSSFATTAGGYYQAVRKSTGVLTYTCSGTGSLTYFHRAVGFDCGLIDLTYPSDELLQQAKSKALAAVDKAPYAIAEDIAEIRETIQFLRHPMASIDDLSRAFSKDVRRNFILTRHGYRRVTKAKAISQAWLEYRFAFSPLVRTISSALQSLGSGKTRQYDKIQSSHGASYVYKDSDNIDGLHSPFTYKRSCKLEARAHASVQYRVQPPLLEWQYKYGLRIKDVPETMWEIFPLSFMYDRFINISDVIRGVTNLSDPSLKVLGGTTSLVVNKTQTISLVNQSSSTYDITIVPDVDSYTTESYNREVWKPSVLDTVPPVIPGGLVRNLTSMADLATLVVQRLR